MRPVERGGVPTTAAGTPKVYAEYADARGDLYARIGRYCSFCERPIKAGLAVEHIHHMNAHPHLERGGPDGAVVFFSHHTTDGRLYEIVDTDGTVVHTVTLDSLVAAWEARPR